ncbi:SDR family oxidoreductase [Nocardioides sp. JQ2195]|uniref:SDR family NAD(P)-dependent oxidoreductase n=1 Tax=Nocardioides sp. JQ2195 TaxID=2592334 RepID=UPI00143EC0F3|nr:SDR family oxidoreductase [Nocardioides sp. JQ2195]QIX27398.1 SDR family oxidoreductase [Nocardioides sp. JQ2195]
MANPSYDFTHRRVLVVGGTRGLGNTIARRFARAGASVTVTGTQSLRSAYDARLQDYDYQRLDLTNHDSIVRVAEQVGPVDILVNAAGARVPHTADAQEQEFVSHSVRLGLLGPTQLAHRLRHRLAESQMRGGGAVISTHHLRRWCEMAVGGANAHTEMLNTTSRLAAAWGSNGIRVNAVASTVVVPRQAPQRGDLDKESGPVLTRTRTQRTGTLHDVAEAALFLASSGAAFITGQTLMVNGSGAGGARIAH